MRKLIIKMILDVIDSFECVKMSGKQFTVLLGVTDEGKFLGPWSLHCATSTPLYIEVSPTLLSVWQCMGVWCVRTLT